MNILHRLTISATALAVLSIVAFSPLPVSALTNQSIGVPAFEKPGVNSYWSDVRLSRSANIPFVVANPANGPGTTVDEPYDTAIHMNNDAFIRTLGYVQTNFQTRNFKEVYADINTWYRLYPKTSGVYIDLLKEGSQAEVCYVAALYTHVKSIRPNDLVVLSPGSHISPSYEPYGDIFVTANQDYATYKNWRVQYKGFEDKALYQNRFWHIIHGIDSESYSGALEAIRGNNAGWLFMTDKREPNPFNSTPSFWQAEVNDVGALPASAIPNRGKTALPRGCISLSASAASDVDSRTAKRSITTSTITVNNTSPTYDSEAATSLKLISLPKGTIVKDFKAEGWSCSAADRQCQYGAAFPAGTSLANISAHLEADCNYAGGDVVLRLSNYTGNQWDTKLPMRAPFGCESGTEARKLNGENGGLLTSITTESMETTPTISPLGEPPAAEKQPVAAPPKKDASAAPKIIAFIIIAIIIAGLAVWGIIVHRKRKAYSVNL